MTNYAGLEKLVEDAIISAVDDGTWGTLKNIQFDIDKLARVMKRVHTADRLNAAVAKCDEQMKHWIIAAADANQDRFLFGHARAALSLSEKLTAPSRRYRDDDSGGFERLTERA